MRPLRALALSAFALLLVEGTAGAVKLRRPYSPNIARNYGFDNNGSAAGCRDNACGSTCYDTHTGTDFPVPLGTDIVAGADGVVIATFNGCANYGYAGNTCGGRCGNYVSIRHPDGDQSLYCHMMLDSIVVSVGTTVACGQKIGRSASSGSSTGPHVHVAVRPGGGASVDSYSGACTSSKGYWVSQAAAPGTSCECSPSPEVCDGRDNDCDGAVDEDGVCCTPTAEVCDGKDNDCDGAVDEDEVCEVQELLQVPESYAPTKSSDVDGDRRADVCGRGSAGVWCQLASTAFAEKTQVLEWSDANGWSDLAYSSTIRLGDIDGDGKADICARASNGIICNRSNGTGFGEQIAGPEWSDKNGWKNPRFLTTMRLADVNGDGKLDVCARSSSGLHCALSKGDSFGESFAGPAWSDAAGFGSAKYYGTLRMADVDGDGKDDACIRTPAGFECYRSNGAGFDRKFEFKELTDAGGWGAQKYWSTIRLGDVNGDGRADLCARYGAGLVCHLSTGDGFGEGIQVAALSDANGWDDPTNYRTLRIADIDGDGAGDLCARSNTAVECYRYDGTGFVRVAGPKMADADGWGNIQHHGPMMFGDSTGDRRADLFARAAAGGVIFPSNGGGFDANITIDEFKNDGGWGDPKYWSTLRFGGQCVAQPETCNGRDDDCDGQIDEEGVCGSGSYDGGPVGAESPSAAATPDENDLQGSCGCRTTGREAAAPWALLAIAALLGRRRSR